MTWLIAVVVVWGVGAHALFLWYDGRLPAGDIAQVLGWPFIVPLALVIGGFRRLRRRMRGGEKRDNRRFIPVPELDARFAPPAHVQPPKNDVIRHEGPGAV